MLNEAFRSIGISNSLSPIAIYSSYPVCNLYLSAAHPLFNFSGKQYTFRESRKTVSFEWSTCADKVLKTISVATVYKGNIIKNLIMDCQSYTKYRPNETNHGSSFPLSLSSPAQALTLHNRCCSAESEEPSVPVLLTAAMPIQTARQSYRDMSQIP